MSVKRKILLKIEITLLVSIITVISITFVLPIDRASVPHPTDAAAEHGDSSDTVTGAEDIADGGADYIPAEDDTPEEPEDTFSAQYIMLELDESDIGTGDLILVNSDNRYEIPEDNDLVLAGSHKSRSYILLDANAQLSERIMGPLNAMLDDFAAETGLTNVLLYSSFRTLSKQQSVFDDWAQRVGTEEAKRMAASPGHSEHHTGLALDLAIYADDIVSTFKGAGSYAWIHDNAHKYGFILRYLEDKQDITKTAYEPWHFRYLGIPHAYFAKSKGYAYEEYMDYMMCFDFEGEHMMEIYDGILYEVYYVPGLEVPVPRGLDYTISGNNIDGFIVTVNHGRLNNMANEGNGHIE